LFGTRMIAPNGPSSKESASRHLANYTPELEAY
jgi:hypothetical protein